MVQLWHLSPTDTKPDLHKSYATIMEKKLSTKRPATMITKSFHIYLGSTYRAGNLEQRNFESDRARV